MQKSLVQVRSIVGCCVKLAFMTRVVIDKILATVAGLPKLVIISMAHAIKHLSTFSIADAVLTVKFFTRFTERSHMLLNGNTMTNLFVYMISVLHHRKLTCLTAVRYTRTRPISRPKAH